jgi:hypothetical protein
MIRLNLIRYEQSLSIVSITSATFFDLITPFFCIYATIALFVLMPENSFLLTKYIESPNNNTASKQCEKRELPMRKSGFGV